MVLVTFAETKVTPAESDRFMPLLIFRQIMKSNPLMVRGTHPTQKINFMASQKPKTLARLLTKVVPKYGCIISPQLQDYFNQIPQITAGQFAVMLMADDGKDILLNGDFKKQLEQDFIHYFGENSIINHDY